MSLRRKMFTNTFIVLALFLGAPFVFADDDEFKDCKDMMLSMMNKDNKDCCETLNKVKDEKTEKCLPEDMHDFSCEISECMMEDMLNDKKEVDKDKALETFKNMKEKNSEIEQMAKRAEKECLDDKMYEKYYPSKGDCPSMQLQTCFIIHAAVECSTWKDTKNCKDMSEMAEKCKKALDNAGKKD